MIRDEALINEEYKSWKKKTPLLYDLLISHALEWPSVTVEWLPGREEVLDKDYSLQKMILGTHASDDHQNYLIIAEVKLPMENDQNDNDNVDAAGKSGSGDIGEVKLPSENANDVADRGDDDDVAETGASGHVSMKVQITQQITHDGDVNRARHMPQNSFFIATKSSSGNVNLFDYRKHPSKTPLDGKCDPDLILKGHSAEGYGLSWSPFRNGHLLSASEDANICLWDINASPQNKDLEAMQIYKFHEGIVNDVSWHPKDEYLFGSVGDDKNLHISDLRTPSVTKPSQSVVAHEREVNCLAFNPFNEFVVATGSSDSTVKLFDLRKITKTVHTLHFHKNDLFQVGWSPQNETILASSCDGRRLVVWDVSRIGDKLPPEEAEEGPPELLFIHGGHTSKVTEFSWNPNEDWVMASVAGDCIVQIWKMADHIYNDEGDLPKGDDSEGSSSRTVAL